MFRCAVIKESVIADDTVRLKHRVNVFYNCFCTKLSVGVANAMCVVDAASVPKGYERGW